MFKQLGGGGGYEGGLETLRVNKAVAHLTMNGATKKQLNIRKKIKRYFGNIESIAFKRNGIAIA